MPTFRFTISSRDFSMKKANENGVSNTTLLEALTEKIIILYNSANDELSKQPYFRRQF